MGFQKVTGTCPSCGSDNSLYLASGGFVTCARASCPDPGRAADLLETRFRGALDMLAEESAPNPPEGRSGQYQMGFYHGYYVGRTTS